LHRRQAAASTGDVIGFLSFRNRAYNLDVPLWFIVVLLERPAPMHMPKQISSSYMNERGERTFLAKTFLFEIIVIATNVIGNYALKRGLVGVAIVESFSPFAYVHAMAHPWVASGIVLLICWLGSRLALLSWADLTYVVPVTSVSYALTAVAAAVFLGEAITVRQWVGILCITGGAFLVGVTFPNTTELPEEAR
jgi:uncharacterized membrane protein